MRKESNFYRISIERECIVCASGLEYLQGDAIQASAHVFAPGTLRARFHVQGRASRWPRIIATDRYQDVQIYSRELADKILTAGLTGIDFQHLNLTLETIKGGLKGKEHLCPEYVWGRIHGIVRVEHFISGRPAQLDASGTKVLDDLLRLSLTEHHIKISDDQPWAEDFCLVLPNAGRVHFVISTKAADFFESQKLKEMSIFAKGDGYLV